MIIQVEYHVIHTSDEVPDEKECCDYVSRVVYFTIIFFIFFIFFLVFLFCYFLFFSEW